VFVEEVRRMARFVCPGCGEIVMVDGVDRVKLQHDDGTGMFPGRVEIRSEGAQVHTCADGAYLDG